MPPALLFFPEKTPWQWTLQESHSRDKNRAAQGWLFNIVIPARKGGGGLERNPLNGPMWVLHWKKVSVVTTQVSL